MSSQLPLILLAGMGADHRLFQAQSNAFPNVTTPAWIPPQPRESLPSYARRLAAEIDPGGPCFLGGCSLGGMLALEVARHLQARACLLISSIRSPDELPLRYRMLRPLAGIATQPLRLLPWAARGVQATGRRWMSLQRQILFQQAADADGRFLAWAAWAVLQWTPQPPVNVPIIQIHGTRDRVLPHTLTRPEVLVPGGGHVLPVTHPDLVNQFLRNEMARWAAAPAPG